MQAHVRLIGSADSFGADLIHTPSPARVARLRRPRAPTGNFLLSGNKPRNTTFSAHCDFTPRWYVQ